MISLPDKTECCGCGACRAACPHGAIAMKPDAEGFLQPVVDENLCTSCGLCRKVCPLNAPFEPDSAPGCFAFQTNDDGLLSSSSSGGAFSEIVRPVLESGGCVFGCALSDDGLKPIHVKIETWNELGRLRGSKYVQSDIGDTYVECRNELKSGRNVCFTGTPCQILGLKRFLGWDYPNLLAIDIICHGVPSPKVLAKYKTEIEAVANSRLKGLDFRNKSAGWVVFSMAARFVDASRDFIEKIKDNLYLRVFLSNLSLRESCFVCPARGGRSGADITLADFWGVQNFAPEMFDDRGTSLVLVHTRNGRDACAKIHAHGRVQEVSFDASIAHNPSYRINAARPARRNRFFKEIDRRPLADAFKKSTKRSLFIRAVGKLKRMLVGSLLSKWDRKKPARE